MSHLEDIERQYGKRFRLPIGHGEGLKWTHWRGQTANGQKFVYCPVGFLVSWNDEDYDNYYCPWCKTVYTE
jgi:hypothetical protein